MISAQLLADCITVLEPARLLILVLAAVIVRLFWFSAWPEIFLFRFFSFQPSQPTLAVSLDCEEAHADIAGMASSSYFLHLAKAEAQAAFWLVINFYVSWILHSEMVLAMLARFVLSQPADSRDIRALHVYRHHHTGVGGIFESLYLPGTALKGSVVVLGIVGRITGLVHVQLAVEE